MPTATLSEASTLFIMGKNKPLSSEMIAQVVVLKQSGLQMKKVSEQIGGRRRSVRSWFAKFHRNFGVRLLPIKYAMEEHSTLVTVQ